MKYAVLRTKLLRDAAIYGGSVLVLLGLTVGVSMLEGSYEEKYNSLNSQTQSLHAEASALEAQLTKARESLMLYNTINRKNQNAGFELNRENATKMLNGLKESYRLSGLSLKMSPVATIADEQLQKKTGSVIASDVTLTFNGLTDIHLLAFANAIKTQFPGYVRFSKLEMSRVSGLSKDVFLAISRGVIPNLVQAQLQFKWLGLKYTAATIEPLVDPSVPPVEGGP